MATKNRKAPGAWPCEEQDCGRVFNTARGLVQHLQRLHGLDITLPELLASQSRGKKAAATRKKNAAAQQKAEIVESLIDITDEPVIHSVNVTPARNSRGRFTRNVLEEWDRMLSHIEGAESFLAENGFSLTEARLSMTTELGGQTFVATFDGKDWAVEAQ